MAVEPLRDAHGTPGFRGTPVEKHRPNVIDDYVITGRLTITILCKFANPCTVGTA